MPRICCRQKGFYDMVLCGDQELLSKFLEDLNEIKSPNLVNPSNTPAQGFRVE